MKKIILLFLLIPVILQAEDFDDLFDKEIDLLDKPVPYGFYHTQNGHYDNKNGTRVIAENGIVVGVVCYSLNENEQMGWTKRNVLKKWFEVTGWKRQSLDIDMKFESFTKKGINAFLFFPQYVTGYNGVHLLQVIFTKEE